VLRDTFFFVYNIPLLDITIFVFCFCFFPAHQGKESDDTTANKIKAQHLFKSIISMYASHIFICMAEREGERRFFSLTMFGGTVLCASEYWEGRAVVLLVR
jgi:hypothetical protein